MTIYPNTAHPFTCVICERQSPSKWENPARKTVPPICHYCERTSGGGMESQMDHRLNRQIKALANELHWLGLQKEYEGKRHART